MLGTACLPASKVANPICAKSVAVAVAKTICSDVQTLKRLLPPSLSLSLSPQLSLCKINIQATHMSGQLDRQKERESETDDAACGWTQSSDKLG